MPSGVGQWYVGPGRAGPPGERNTAHGDAALRPVTDRMRSGAVQGAWWAERPIRAYPPRGIRTVRGRAHDVDMQLTTTAVPNRDSRDSVMGGTFVGTLLVLGGLWLAYVAWSTPILAAIAAAMRPGSTTAEPGLPMFALALAVPATFVVVGTNRLARTAGAIRRTWHGRGDRLSRIVPADIVIARGVTLDDGRPGPTLLVGPFGLVAALETKVVIAEDLEWAIKDADRVRHWLTQNDQDFVVRVHAVVIGQPAGVDRVPGCALITVEQLPAWLESLPHQRSLSEARLARLVKLVKPRA